jgi:Fe-S-cluster containining protein
MKWHVASEALACRPKCAACCIAPSISTPIPGHPEGKPAGVRCANLDDELRCRLWGTDRYPAVCRGFPPRPDSCGASRDDALRLLTAMETETAPKRVSAPGES